MKIICNTEMGGRGKEGVIKNVWNVGWLSWLPTLVPTHLDYEVRCGKYLAITHSKFRKNYLL